MCKILYCKVNSNAFKIAISLLFFYILNTYASIPVLSDIKILGSSRGLAVSISADLPFEVKFKKTSSNTVRVLVSDCVYGLSTFNFLSFKAGVPITKIIVKEIKENSMVQIDIVVSDKMNLELESQMKNNQWIALLSRSSCKNFKWSASESDGLPSQKDEPVKAPPPAAVVPASLPVTQIPVADKLVDAVKLIDVSVLQRNKIYALSFELNKIAKSTIKRIKDTVYLQIPNAGIGLKSDKIEVPSGTPFSSIKIKEQIVDKQSYLLITIALDKKNYTFQNGVVFKKGTTITFFSNSSSDEKLSQWNTGKGVLWEQRLYGLPTYDIDMKFLEERAIKDAGGVLNDESAFFTKEKDSSINKKEKVPEDSDTRDLESKDPPKSAGSELNATDSKATEAVSLEAVKKNDPLIITTNNANLRAEPSVSSDVLCKLTIGDKLELLKTNGLWDNVKFKAMTGWMYRKNVTDSSKVSAAIWREINRKQATIPQVSESPIIKQETESPEKIIAQLGNNSDTAAVFADSGFKSTQKHEVKYNKTGRDPFLPLATDKVEETDGANVEHLKLVGVLLDNTEQIALFEDLKANRKPFALRENESVDHGKVLKIYKDKVVFLITEYGISRSYTIRLATKQEQGADQ